MKTSNPYTGLLVKIKADDMTSNPDVDVISRFDGTNYVFINNDLVTVLPGTSFSNSTTPSDASYSFSNDSLYSATYVFNFLNTMITNSTPLELIISY